MALPCLDLMAETSDSEDPMRMVCVGLNFGLVPQLFFPKQTGENYELTDRLKPLAGVRDKFSVFSGLDHGVNAQGGHGGVHAFLSGVLSKNSAGMPEANISVDQKAAQVVGSKNRFASLQFASGNDPNNMLSWSASGVSIPPISDPQRIFSLLFQKTDPALRDQRQQALAAQKSILDLVKNDADLLTKRVGAEDRKGN